MVSIMKKKVNFFDRPPSVGSGTPLGKRVIVQHRCDILMEEQVDKVRDIQDCLQRELVALDLSRSLTEISERQEKVEELKNQLDEMLLLLKVASKMTAEMKHSRAELRRHLKQGEDVTAWRKRVSWLERRIERVLHVQSQQTCKSDDMVQLVTSPPGDTAAERAQEVGEGDMEEAPSDTEQAPVPEHVTEPDIAPVSAVQAVEQTTVVEDGTTARTDSDTPMSPTRKISGVKSELDEEKSEGPMEVDLTRYRSDTPFHASYPQGESEQSSAIPERSSRRLVSRDRVTLSEGISTTISSSSSSSSSSEEEEDDEEEPDKDEEDWDEEEEEQEEEFDIEVKLVSVLRKDTPLQSSGRQSRVTIQTVEGELEEPSPSPIAAEEYWASEHHRFQFSDSIDALLQNDPLSYHSMGMAVPGTFVDQPESTGVELPWRQRRKGSDIVDVHKIALDKLSTRVHQMYRKVKDAALLSVEKTKDDYLGRLVLGGSVSRVEMSETDFPSPSMQKPTLARYGVTRASSRETVIFPPLDKERLGSSYSGRLIYYPKPLPYPDKTRRRTTKSKEELPVLPSHFRPGESPEPPQRIVNQHNLYNETKFTSSLYKPKLSLSGEERKLLQLKEEEERRKRERAKRRRRRRREEEKKAAPTLKTTFALATAMVKMSQGVDDRWNEMKPKSGALEHSGLKWERVKNIVHNSLVSPHEEERVDAARQLGELKCCDTMVLFALRERVTGDECERVRYESAKSLITLGMWEEEVLEQVLEHLVNGSRETKADLLEHIIDGKNVQFVNKKAEVFPELVKVLSLLCKNPDSTDEVSFRAAVCLGKLCVQDRNAQEKLSEVLEQTHDTHIRAEALKMLIKQMCYHEQVVVEAALVQLQRSPAWRLRKEAADLLIHLGQKHVCADHTTDLVYELLEKRLWDDPNKEVRNEVAMVLAALQLYPRACETIEKKLEAPSEDVRAQAVISLGTLRMKNDRVIKQLLEMLDLDSSEYVRLMILRTLATLRSTERKVVRSLREREKGDGPLAKEAKRTLQILGLPLNPTSTK